MSVASAKTPILAYATTNIVGAVSTARVTFFTKVLPKGKWLITGSVQFQADTALATLPGIQVLTNIGIYLFASNATTGPTSTVIPFTLQYTSDGTTAIILDGLCATSAGTWSSSSAFSDIFCNELL